mmetsp:Transcript_4861/g.14714  ORF Transcript_4861/g.14714 Transcript_4861/m.14714 type:complete len:312 (-) Transcript_4861:139-1074(-)
MAQAGDLKDHLHDVRKREVGLEDVARHLSVGEIREKAVLAAHNGVDNVGVRDDDALGHSCGSRRVHDDGYILRCRGSRLPGLCAAGVHGILELLRVPSDVLEVGEGLLQCRGSLLVVLLHGVTYVEDVLARSHLFRSTCDRVSHLGKKLRVGNYELRLGLREAVGEPLLSEGGIDGHHGKRLGERGEGGEHPLELCLGVDDHLIPWLQLGEGNHACGKRSHLFLVLCIRDERVLIGERELLDGLSGLDLLVVAFEEGALPGGMRPAELRECALHQLEDGGCPTERFERSRSTDMARIPQHSILEYAEWLGH